MTTDIERQVEIVKRGTVAVTTDVELRRKLAKGVPLKIKLGVDPTAPDIHLGHTVVLRKLRQFQDLGHQAILIIGDFTALIGDPTGRMKTRPPLEVAEIERNAATYLDQVGKVLDMKRLSIRRNSEWLKPLTFTEVMNLAAKLTVARLIERDDFSQRFKNNIEIGLHEFMYPLMQAYDSVVVEADVEIGGNDQLVNLLMGRRLQRATGQEEQVALTLPLLVGTDGVQKMSKSYGNHIGVSESAVEMYSKAMSVPDGVMKDYFTLLTGVAMAEVDGLLAVHPMTAKKRLAREIVLGFHNEESADDAARQWDAVMSRKEAPEEMPDISVDGAELKEGKVWIVRLVALTGITKSNGEARRLIAQGGVEINAEKVTDPDAMVAIAAGDLLKIGKKRRYFRISLG
ncbi:MAG: tyrosine--tRNA ligase [Planctomycetes bacterium RBG_16_59_8]|nr:MAG: tyrosine--tRNA ligase [Planctomycetes bacterium RBG_16_59_8]